MARFSPAAHPRDAHGRFRPKFSQSVRLSPISASYNAGARVPIVPGRANLYIGALVRVESAGGGKALKRHTDRLVNSVASRFGDSGGSSHLAQVLKGNQVQVRGLNVQGPRNVIKPPTFRVSSTPASRTAGQVRVRTRVRNVRRPRIARTPSVTSKVRSSVPVARPRALPPRASAGRRTRRRRKAR